MKLLLEDKRKGFGVFVSKEGVVVEDFTWEENKEEEWRVEGLLEREGLILSEGFNKLSWLSISFFCSLNRSLQEWIEVFGNDLPLYF